MAKSIGLKTAELEKISHLDYFNIALSVDCVIFAYDEKELKVLVIKSDLEEFSGMYSLLGDLVRLDEDLDAASYRILRERTGMEDVFLEQVHTFGSINRHPSGRVVTTAYYSLIDVKHRNLRLNNNELHWHSVKGIKKMAFDHKTILDTCLNRLREQSMEHPVVFNLLPEKFHSENCRNYMNLFCLWNWTEEISERKLLSKTGSWILTRWRKMYLTGQVNCIN